MVQTTQIILLLFSDPCLVGFYRVRFCLFFNAYNEPANLLLWLRLPLNTGDVWTSICCLSICAQRLPQPPGLSETWDLGTLHPPVLLGHQQEAGILGL